MRGGMTAGGESRRAPWRHHRDAKKGGVPWGLLIKSKPSKHTAALWDASSGGGCNLKWRRLFRWGDRLESG